MKRYEFGQPILHQRLNLNRDCDWMGSWESRMVKDDDAGDVEEYHLPLQGGGGQYSGIKQIVSV